MIKNDIIKKYAEIILYTIISNKDEVYFSIYLDRIGHNNTKHLSNEEHVVTSIESGKYNYYYFDLYKDYNTKIFINSFGQDLEVYTKHVISKKITI